MAIHQHQIDNTLADPQGELRDIVLVTPSALAGYVPNEVCHSIVPGSTNDGICVTGLRGFTLYWADQTRSALEPATCVLWTAAGWHCD